MHGVLVNRLGGLSLPRKSVVRLTDRPDITLDVYRGRKITIQQQQQQQAPINIFRNQAQNSSKGHYCFFFCFVFFCHEALQSYEGIFEYCRLT